MIDRYAKRFPAIAKYFGLDKEENQPIAVLSRQLVEKGVTPYQLRKAQLEKKEEVQRAKAKQQYDDILKEIKGYDAGFLSSFSNTEKRLVRNLRRTGSLTDAVIDAELEKGIVSRAMRAFDHAARGTYLDHVINTEELAYAIVRHPTMFTEDQLKLLRSRLDHGMSMKDFKDEYYKPNMVQDLRKAILAPNPKPSKRPRYDGGFSHCC